METEGRVTVYGIDQAVGTVLTAGCMRVRWGHPTQRSGFHNADGAAVMERLRRAAAAAEPDEWIAAFGYDPILIRDLRSLDADTLDEISSTHPIFIMIQSMHTVYVNHRALEVAGIDRSTAAGSHR